jgi:hypothetical protein
MPGCEPGAATGSTTPPLPNSRRHILGDGSQSVRRKVRRPAEGFARSALDDLEHPPVLYYLAAHKGANPLAALTEAYQSAYLACAVLPGIGLALAFLLPGRPRKPAHELPEPARRPMPLPQETW